MKQVAQIGISILGIYLITRALSQHARSFWSLTSEAGIRDLIMVFGPALIMLVGGLFCLAFRTYISSWILKGQKIDFPTEINIDRIECLILSFLGIVVLLEAVPYFALTVNHFLLAPNIQRNDFGSLPLKSYAFVQSIAVAAQLFLACSLIFFPKKVQIILRKIRGF